MTLHLVKLCVGIDSITHLRDVQAARLERQKEAGEEPLLFHRTRQTPRRREQVLDGGSLYWVIKGVIQLRQQIVDLRAFRGEDGINRCDIVLDPVLIATRSQRRRGGSLYWVIKGVIQLRQQIVDLRAFRGEDGINRCDIMLDPVLIATRSQRRRAFQGWRYFEPDDAPPDLGPAGVDDDEMPPELKAELMELGLL